MGQAMADRQVPSDYDRYVLDFEKPIVDLERKIEELKQLTSDELDFSKEIGKLEAKARKLQEKIFAELSAWQKVQLSRHPGRPYTLDYVEQLFEDFVELHGDRAFADDESVVAGLALFEDRPVLVIGHQKGRSTKENLRRNFGMPRPEGYRKAVRLMELGARFERPILATVIGEGGSGGALAIGVADRIVMLEYSIYSVISPEPCSSILWRDPSHAAEAAEALKLTAADIHRLGIADEVVPEPPGGAHRDFKQAADLLRPRLSRHLSELLSLPKAELIEARYRKYRSMGVWEQAVRKK